MKITNQLLTLFFIIGFNVLYAQGDRLNDYVQPLDGSQLQLEMAAIPAGKFLMGSPALEHNRNKDEGPVHEVSLSAFYISKYEITWEIYNLFVNRTIDSVVQNNKAKDLELGMDAIAGATVPYVDMSLGMGTGKGLPVGNITHYAAAQFCKWLSAKTGHFYRLPTEAEWEYSARAGTSTAYYFGDDPNLLKDYAWYYENSNDTYHPVGQKLPNAWGLYDMHGNVTEWTLDHYVPEAYSTRVVHTQSPWEQLATSYPHTVRGGSYYDDAEYVRSAARLGSTENWKMRDPQFPKSKWWNTDAPFVGFRVVRDPNIPNENEIHKYWGE
ncbi:formylglycine-generating enzyme family protein [Maribacter sp. MAR_2009_72]|uniref:formylglycine-generating enzyme family protein n=1 Tax=Maribacter sp. MAR_2009_72 TaxID=1250050 RepID=UPI00119ACD09|nr:formylglycine-generating enzyme family protein [Maribacter sp. MAR_2009_72]TVZ16995.1 formylglycine-generating enzyme required for sulfatase activity [Maribacter sp. MAR_2009_72]